MATTHDPKVKAQVLKEYVESTDNLDVISARHGVARSTIVKWATSANVTRTKKGAKKRRTTNRDGSARALKDSDGAWVYDGKGIARWTPRSEVS